MNKKQQHLWYSILTGAAAGALGSCAMNAFQQTVPPPRVQFPRGSPHRQGTQHANAQSQPTVSVAKAAWGMLTGNELNAREQRIAGPLVHYSYGAGIGALYGLGLCLIPALSAGRGLLFGAVAWAVGDELMLPATGLARGPQQYSYAMHFYALTGHLVYGLTTDAAHRILT